MESFNTRFPLTILLYAIYNVKVKKKSTSYPLRSHVRFVGGSAGGDVQLARNISPIEYQLF